MQRPRSQRQARRPQPISQFTATRCGLISGVNTPLRQISEVYAAAGGHEKLVRDFVSSWYKVMVVERRGVDD